MHAWMYICIYACMYVSADREWHLDGKGWALWSWRCQVRVAVLCAATPYITPSPTLPGECGLVRNMPVVAIWGRRTFWASLFPGDLHVVSATSCASQRCSLHVHFWLSRHGRVVQLEAWILNFLSQTDFVSSVSVVFDFIVRAIVIAVVAVIVIVIIIIL